MDERRKEWYRQRVENIHQHVNAFDILRHIGVSLRQASDDRQEQLSCPFHGADKKPSARVYPEEGDNKSHVWCYVCQEPGWDAIGLWKRFNNVKFSEALSSLERFCNISAPDLPQGLTRTSVEAAEDTELEAFKKRFLYCDSRLVSLKPVYKELCDLQSYLAAGSALDRIKYRVDKGTWEPEKGVRALDQLLERISDKVATCPAG